MRKSILYFSISADERSRVLLSLSALCFIPERTNERKNGYLCLFARLSGRLVHVQEKVARISFFLSAALLFFQKSRKNEKFVFVLMKDNSKV